MKNAATVPDRTDAAEALAKFKDDDAVIAGLGESTKKDSFWGVRAEAARALGRISTPAAAKRVLAALSNQGKLYSGNSPLPPKKRPRYVCQISEPPIRVA